MTDIIAAVMQEVHNFFERGKISGSISITSGMVLPDIKAPYVYIKGSSYHDGLWEAAASSLMGDSFPDETFKGCVWLLYPPRDFLVLCGKIAEFEAKTPVGALQSESLEGYAYSLASGQNGVLTWQEAFASRLRPYRRMFKGVG